MTITTTTQAPPHETVWSLAQASVPSRCLQVVAELGVADHIDDDPVPVDDLAARCGVAADALDRVLRLVAAHGVFAYVDGAFGHNDESRLLRSDHPMSMRAFARLNALAGFAASFAALDECVRTGVTAFDTVEKNGLWSYLGAHPDEASIFDQAMTAKAQADIAAVLGAYDFGRFTTVADIGGGRGHLLTAIADAAPNTSGVLFELPGVIDSLTPAPARLSYHPGDFFVDPLPSADAYVLMEVIHDWADREALAILGAVRSAARPGATLLIIEAVLTDDHLDRRSQTLDVIMLTITGGRERTASQLESLFGATGFRTIGVVETGGPSRIVEAVAV